jgi:hypothetical protein
MRAVLIENKALNLSEKKEGIEELFYHRQWATTW